MNRHGAYDSAAALRREAEQRAREAPARRAAIHAALEQAFRGDVAGMTTARDLIAAEHGIRIDERVGEEFSARGRVASGPPITPEHRWIHFGSWLHEISHGILGPCGGADHEAKIVGDTRSCLACESSAWLRSEELIRPFIFTRDMHQHMRHCLLSYRHVTPGPPSAVKALDETAGSIHYLEALQRERKWRHRVETVERWRQEVKGRR